MVPKEIEENVPPKILESKRNASFLFLLGK
jgi:hypothetical protein